MDTHNLIIQSITDHDADLDAVSERGRCLTYAGLSRISSLLAMELCSSGVGTGTVVSVMAQGLVDEVTAACAVWRCGAPVLFLDPDNPLPRLRELVQASGTGFILYSEGLEAQAELLHHSGAVITTVEPGGDSGGDYAEVIESAIHRAARPPIRRRWSATVSQPMSRRTAAGSMLWPDV